MTKYDNGGAFDFNWLALDRHEQMASTVRDFIWVHWTQKRLGHIARTVYSIEGDPTTYHLFIEPDAHQNWHVLMTYRSDCCWFYSFQKPKRKRRIEMGAVRFDVIERVAKPDTSRDSNLYMLRLHRMGDQKSEDYFVL